MVCVILKVIPESVLGLPLNSPFTVQCLVVEPLNRSKARVSFVVIEIPKC